MERRGERFDLLGFSVTLLEPHPEGQFSVQEWRAPPGVGGIPMHVHHHTVEAFYVIEGELAVWLDDERLVCGAGSYVVARPGQRHTFCNPGRGGHLYLATVTGTGAAA